jgi:hypothetical protein
LPPDRRKGGKVLNLLEGLCVGDARMEKAKKMEERKRPQNLGSYKIETQPEMRILRD